MPSSPVGAPWRRSLALVCVTAVLWCAGCASPTPEAATSTTASPVTDEVIAGELREVLSLIAERLATAPAVAAAKEVGGQLVTDRDREQSVLEAAQTEAERQDVDTSWVREVFADQITANKDVQFALLDDWRVGVSPAPTQGPDLAAEVRPILDRLTPALIGALAGLEPYRGAPGCASVLAEVRDELDGQVEPAVETALVRATENLCMA
ncbi:chorismate mutase [Microbacterium sp. SLBN-154]|uniref:gamma subclass chorismate mutase AroQ n=1 Tax=Microbacterium sp. SLBN-154 TaxID=2768458 RepID=UPI00114F0210|nr:gamma subclass chorismate mutase AroQ [Microbacterium sp. SLBN-154]TQK19843.1 chorismate mutase [Microbacterium sp. SLBN-154]